MLSLGWSEMAFIFVLALLLFGPKKLPELGKQAAKLLADFRRASNELKSTFEREMQEIERESQSIRQEVEKHTSELQAADSSYNYNYDSYYDYGSYGSESYDSTTSNTTSTVSASATEGAESPVNGTSHAEPSYETAEAVSAGEPAATGHHPAGEPASHGSEGEKPVPANS